jgi:hypothetical protein
LDLGKIALLKKRPRSVIRRPGPLKERPGYVKDNQTTFKSGVEPPNKRLSPLLKQNHSLQRVKHIIKGLTQMKKVFLWLG